MLTKYGATEIYPKQQHLGLRRDEGCSVSEDGILSGGRRHCNAVFGIVLLEDIERLLSNSN
jgi:hypothetical protein